MKQADAADCREIDGLWDWNLQTNRIHFSPRWASMVGCDGQEIGNTPDEWFCRIHPEDRKQVEAEIASLRSNASPVLQTQHRLRHKDGTYRWMSCRGFAALDHEGRPVRLSGTHSDITARKVADPLTGMPNRDLLMDRLTRSIELAKRRNDFLFAVLLLDLDRFKSTAERLGASATDQLLIAAARRIETCLRTSDTVIPPGREHLAARLERDEFTILLEGLHEIAEAKIVAERLLKEIAVPFRIDGHEVFLSASIGMALSPTGYTCAKEVLRDADVALYRAKSLGKARCESFDTVIIESAQTRLQLENDLRIAAGSDEIQVVYQPIVSISGSEIVGFEALARWKHPDRGLISPMEFIPIAERTGLIDPLGRRVLYEACRQLKQWQEDLGISPGIWMSVNLSGVQLAQPSIVKQVEDVLKTVNLDPRCLMLELTESTVMHNPEAVTGILMGLRLLGVRIAIDDFGTGYSSLSYLRQFPADILKVDHCFVRRMGANRDTLAIVCSTVALAHQLGLQVVAEGIEQKEQQEVMKSLQCEYGQGFRYSKPVGPEEAAQLLRDGIHCSETTALPGDIDPWRLRFLRIAIALTAVVFLAVVAVGVYALRVYRTVAPQHATHIAPPPPVQVTASAPTPFAPVESLRAVPSTATTLSPSRKAPLRKPAATQGRPAVIQAVLEKSQAPEPIDAAVTLEVIHDHRLGSCRGKLSATQEGISFVPENGNDGFSFKHTGYSTAITNDRLTIKSDKKTWHFKSARSRSKDENVAKLERILRIIPNKP